MESVWVFHGNGGSFASAVFSSKELAEAWIAERGVQGTLTKYPIDVCVYDWAIENEFFSPKRPEHSTPLFIQKFSSAYQEHEHYVDDDDDDE